MHCQIVEAEACLASCMTAVTLVVYVGVNLSIQTHDGPDGDHPKSQALCSSVPASHCVLWYLMLYW